MLQKLREKLPAARLPGWSGAASPLVWQALAFGGGFLAGGGQLFGGLHPFSLALVLGLQADLVSAAAAGGALGCLLLLEPVAAMGHIGAVAAALAGRRVVPRKFWAGAVAGCGSLLSVQLMLSLTGMANLQASLAALGDAVLALLLGQALRQRQTGGANSPLSSAAALMMGVACLQQFGCGAWQPGLVLFGAVCLALARQGQQRQTAMLSVALAGAVLAASPELAFGAIGVASGCVLAAAFAPGEPMACGALLLAGCIPGALAAPGPVEALAFMGTTACIELAALLLPQGLVRALGGALPPESSAKPTLAGAAGRLTAVGEALTDIADTVNAVCERLPPKTEDFNWVIEQTAAELCRECGRRRDCWARLYEETAAGFLALEPILQRQGQVQVEQLPGTLSRCVHPSQLCSTCGRCWARFHARRETRAQAGVLRAAVTEQYSAVAGALTQMAEELGRAARLDPGRSARVADFFAGIGLEPLEAAVTLDTLGRMEARVTVNRTAFTREEQQQLSWELGRLCRRQFVLPALSHCRTVTTLVFQEQPVYCPVFGWASRSARQGQPCGDAAEHFCDSFGQAHLLLCDGMGTGGAAAVDGRMACTLTGKLLRAGVAAESAARLVNVALSLKGEEESGATLDLASADLYTGQARLYKAGAAPSFLVRGGTARVLQGSSLPVGILAQVVGRSQQFQLHEKDWLVLVSDGALADGEGWVLQQLELSARSGCSPQQAAAQLVEMARSRAEEAGRPDDITAAVLQLSRAAG